MLEVMLRRLANDAMRSDPRAMKLLLFLIDRYAESPEVGPHLEEMLAEDREILMHFLQPTKARKGINPFTKEPTIFKAKPARKIIRARPVKAAKDAVA
jgi:hypothetical protein